MPPALLLDVNPPGTCLAALQDAMVFGADFYESESSIQACTAANPPVGIGENSFITNAIIEKNCRIGGWHDHMVV